MFIDFDRGECCNDGFINCFIEDTDFIDYARVRQLGLGGEFWLAIIDIYEKRKLNVAANFALAVKKYPWNNWRDWNRQHNPKFLKYEADIEKFLMLM